MVVVSMCNINCANAFNLHFVKSFWVEKQRSLQASYKTENFRNDISWKWIFVFVVHLLCVFHFLKLHERNLIIFWFEHGKKPLKLEHLRKTLAKKKTGNRLHYEQAYGKKTEASVENNVKLY